MYKADLSVVPGKDAEGILAMLGNDELVNSKYPKSRLWFSDLKVKGGIAVYQDMQKKSFVIQDIDPQDDPNISGGTTFLIGLYIEPTQYGDTTIEANRKIAKYIQSKSITFPIQQGESIRFLANSNIDDGFYLQSGTDGKPLFEVVVNFKEMVGMPFIPDEFDKGATKSYE